MSFVPRDHLEKLPSPAFYEILDVADELRAEGFCVRRRARKFLLCRARGNGHVRSHEGLEPSCQTLTQ